MAASTEVLACLAATSVFTHRRQGKLMLNLPKYWLVWRLLRYSHAAGRANQCFKSRSFSLLGAYFGIRTPPAGLAQAAFTEVLACLPATSVFTRRRQGLLKLHLPKYWLVWRLLRYTHTAGRALVWRLLRYSHTTGRTNSCCIYRSNQDFALYFRNLIRPSTTPTASFTEVKQVFLPTSVISSTPTLPRPPHLRKYGKFFSPLP